jgi:hypothetical protein
MTGLVVVGGCLVLEVSFEMKRAALIRKRILRRLGQ